MKFLPHDAPGQCGESTAFLTGYAERDPGTGRALLTIMRRSNSDRSNVPGLTPDDSRKAVGFAFGLAKSWGWTVDQTDPAMLWVNTGKNEIGCAGVGDFVAFVSDENKARARAK